MEAALARQDKTASVFFVPLKARGLLFEELGQLIISRLRAAQPIESMKTIPCLNDKGIEIAVWIFEHINHASGIDYNYGNCQFMA